MSPKLLFSVTTVVVIGAGWTAGAGATVGQASSSGSAAAVAAKQPELDAWTPNPRLGARTRTEVDLTVPATAAEAGKVTLYVPAGYGLNAAAWPGTSEGEVLVDTGSDVAFGDVKAADPAVYGNTPQAQACAPGPHVGVWVMSLEFLSSSVTVPIFVDPTSGTDAALGAYELQMCLPLAGLASPGGWPIGSKVRDFGLELTALKNPSTASNYVWRAFVSNPDRSGNPDPSTTYELRSDMPLPASLALAGKLDRKHHRAILTGRLATTASTVAGIKVSLYRLKACGCWTSLASTQTSANGSYRFVRPIKKTTTYVTEAFAIGACSTASTAPKGCVDETRAAIDSRNVRVVVPKRR
jgi:hypothetical protein